MFFVSYHAAFHEAPAIYQAETQKQFQQGLHHNFSLFIIKDVLSAFKIKNSNYIFCILSSCLFSNHPFTVQVSDLTENHNNRHDLDNLEKDIT